MPDGIFPFTAGAGNPASATPIRFNHSQGGKSAGKCAAKGASEAGRLKNSDAFKSGYGISEEQISSFAKAKEN